jgi:glutamate synthase (NADPH/NADH) small chain
MERKEIRAWESKCTQEHAPGCVATCPVHVDVRKMNEQIMNGDFNSALKTFQKNVPFPRIISHICDHPCQDFCKRKEVEEDISISNLEKACVHYGEFSKKKMMFRKKGKKAAVIGAGLSGLTAALHLIEKGYDVVIYEINNSIGGSIREFDEKILPSELIEEDFKNLKETDIEIKLNIEVGKDLPFNKIYEEFDVVYVGVGKNKIKDLKIEKINPDTFETDIEKVFAGGSLRIGKKSPILSISDGKRAGISMERYLGKVSLTASRKDYGPYTTQLYVNIEGINKVPKVVTSSDKGYSREEAIAEAKRCIQCECLECVKACKYLEHYESYPRKYVREIANNVNLAIGIRKSKKMINDCTLCGLCGEICPNNLNMADVCKQAREEMIDKGIMPLAIHDFAIRDMIFSNSDKFAMHKNESETQKSKFLFFPGCQLSALSPEYIGNIYKDLLKRLSGGVGLMLGCCGAPADWAGRKELFDEVLKDFYSKWEEMGSPKVIFACSTCYQITKNHLPQIPIVSLWEIYDEYGLPNNLNTKNENKVVAVHDACTTRYEEKIHESVRNILKQLGYTVEELTYSKGKTECCGYGGLVNLVNQELGEKIIKKRIEESSRNYVAYCAMCKEYFASKGKATWHLLDLIYGNDDEKFATKEGPGYSQRHENRIKLKKRLLKDFWGEEMEEKKEEFENIKLIISDEIKEKLEDRLILFEDIQKVIYNAEKTGFKIYNPQKGYFITHYKPEIITYWVAYSIKDDSYIIHSAYSHRLEIVGDVVKS